MTPINRARIILALKIIGCICLFGVPAIAIIESEELGFVDMVVAIAEGVIAAVAWFAFAIIVEAAHWYISGKEPIDNE